jgi:hypothetical protein
MFKAMQDYFDLRTADQTGLTVEQVRTLNRLEADHNRVAESDPYRYPWVEFKVEMDERIKLPRVEFLDSEHGFSYTAVVLADGSLDYKL